MPGPTHPLVVGLVALALLSPAAVRSAPSDRPATSSATEWQATKCARYRAAWAIALTRYGRAGLGPDFLARHDAFLASDCLGPHDVCPRSEAELAISNVMVVQAMNAGTASTFPPFGCR